MNANTLELLLRLAGLILTGLVIANFIAAKRFRYAQNLASTEPIVRQVFYVHCGYIVLIIAALAILCLASPQLLFDQKLGSIVSGFFGLFWGSRVIVQLSYYDRTLRRNDRAWDLFFLAVFSALSAIFTLAAFAP